MWPIRDFYVNIKLFNVRAGGQQFTNMEIVIEDKIKFRKILGNIFNSFCYSAFSQTMMFCSTDCCNNQKVLEYLKQIPLVQFLGFAVSKLIFLVFCFYKMSLIIAKFVRLLIFSCLRANSTFYTSKIPAGRGLFNHKNSSSLLFSLRFFDFLIEPQTIKSHLQLNDLL